jgi:hypothetical protein
MTGRPRLPMPEGFEVFAADHSGDEIAHYFKIARERANRLLREMPVDWRTARKKTLQVRAGRCSVAAAVKAAKIKNTKPFPDDFVEVLMTTTRNEAARHFNMASSTLYAMFRRLPAETQAAISAAGQERKKAASARNAVKAAAASKRAKTPGKTSGVNWGFNKPTSIAPAPGGVAAQAAQHLRRYYVPVFRGDVLSKALAGRYVVGKLSLDEAAMIELARSKGFDQDAWRQVAA